VKWSWTIGKVGGVPIRCHVSLLLFVPYVVFAVSLQFQVFAEFLGVSPARFVLPPLLWGCLLAVALLAAIVVHELAHCWVALRSGVQVHSITLMLLGGVSRIVGEIKSGPREAWMAAAGPLASLAIGGAFLALHFLLPLEPADPRVAALVFGQINVVLAIFNLLPAFPMDGGRILRASLSSRLGRLQATRIAAWVGRAMAVLFALVGVFVVQNPLLVLIAAFVYLGAGAELTSLEMRRSIVGLQLASLLDPRLGVVEPEETVESVAERFLRQNWVAALVRLGPGERIGLLTIRDLERLGRAGSQRRAGEVASDRFILARPDDDFAQILPRLNGDRDGAVVVVDQGGRPLGIVTGEELMRSARLSSIVESMAKRG
jgi:Zn-dependent protease/CBS domain-containing protein